MYQLRKAALDAVAAHFSAEMGGTPPDICLTIGTTRTAVDVATLNLANTNAKPRLRFDKAVLRLASDLDTALQAVVPDGATAMLTITAPILVPSKTEAALEEKIMACIAHGAKPFADTIHGNAIRFRLARGNGSCASKLIVMVHNPDTDAKILLDIAQFLLQEIAAASAKPVSVQCERWLVIAVEGGYSRIEIYRQIYGLLSLRTNFSKIVMVLPGGGVETLAD